MVELALTGTAEHSSAAASHRSNAALRPPFEAEVLKGAAAFKTLAAEWNKLAGRQNSATVFQSPHMLQTWARHFADGRDDALLTVVIRRSRRPVLIWPIFVERSGVVRIARTAGAPIGQYDEILLDPDCKAEELFPAALDALKRIVRPDLVFLERVRADGALRRALSGVEPFGETEGAPYSDLSEGSAGLMGKLKTRVLRQQRKRVRKMEEAGHVEFEIAERPEQAEQWLKEAMALKYEWLRSTGRISRAFVQSGTLACLADLARTCCAQDANPRTLVSRLALDGKTAAIEMGFTDRGVYHIYLGAFAPDVAKLGPGNVLTEKILEWCSEQGITRYDMMAPRSRNKLEWQSGEVEVNDFVLPTTTVGRLYMTLVLRRLMPMLRNFFYALPESLRSRLAGVALRSLKQH
jgi:CelD/BcsL family acetyltransferase involved in cellulose biosynthesis